MARRWVPHLLVLLLDGPARFSELAAGVPGLSRRMMTERLRELEDARIVERIVDPGPPITATYRLTPEGETLRPTMQERAPGPSAGTASGPHPDRRCRRAWSLSR